MPASFNRLDPSRLSDDDLEALEAFTARRGHVMVIDENGQQTELPQAIFRHLLRVADLMRRGQPIVMIPEEETLTTQAAADLLGCSRQHLVNLLETEVIPFEKTGTHRRVRLRDLLAYRVQRDNERRRILDTLDRTLSEGGYYDVDFDPE